MQQRLLPRGQLHHEQVTLGVHQARAFENLGSPLGVADHKPKNGAVGRVDDRDRHDADVGVLEAAQDVDHRPDAVGQEHVELAHARPVAAACGGVIGAGILSETHACPPVLITDYTKTIYARSTGLRVRSFATSVDARPGPGHHAAADIVSAPRCGNLHLFT